MQVIGSYNLVHVQVEPHSTRPLSSPAVRVRGSVVIVAVAGLAVLSSLFLLHALTEVVGRVLALTAAGQPVKPIGLIGALTPLDPVLAVLSVAVLAVLVRLELVGRRVSAKLLGLLSVTRIICLGSFSNGCPASFLDRTPEGVLRDIVRVPDASPVLFSERLTRLAPPPGLDKPVFWDPLLDAEPMDPREVRVVEFLQSYLKAAGPIAGHHAAALPVRDGRWRIRFIRAFRSAITGRSSRH